MRVKPGYESLQRAYNDLYEKMLQEENYVKKAKIIDCMFEMFKLLEF